ncbi:unnamed protein product [Closterium sp. NIES-53]
MYALTDSAEGDCYLSVPLDPGIEADALGASASAAPGTGESAAPGAGESALSGTAPTEALHTFTLDSGASRSFFRDSTTITPLSWPVTVSLADPSGGPVLAHSSTVLPCPAAPSGLLSGLHLPSFSTNQVSGADLQDAWVDQFTLGGQRVTHCTCSRTGRHLATFTRRPWSSLYTLTTAPPPVSASGQVAASSQVFAAASRSRPASVPCSCRPLSHETLLWHHRLGHPLLPCLRGMASRTLVSGRPRSLPPLPPGPAPTCVPCVEGRQLADPHSSTFPPTEAPLQTLHMDVWGPARVRGQGHERYFMLVVDDYSRYTTVFPLRSKGALPEVLIDWIRGAHRQLSEHFGSDLPVQRLHSDRGGEFSSNLLRALYRAEGIRHMWTGKVGDASAFRVWGSRAFVRDTSADKLSSRAVPCVFLGFPRDAPGWQFYHPTLRRVLSSQDVTFDESVSYYYPAKPVEVAVGSGAARGAEHAGARTGGAEPGGAEPKGVESGGAEPAGAGIGGAEPGGDRGVGVRSVGVRVVGIVVDSAVDEAGRTVPDRFCVDSPVLGLPPPPDDLLMDHDPSRRPPLSPSRHPFLCHHSVPELIVEGVVVVDVMDLAVTDVVVVEGAGTRAAGAGATGGAAGAGAVGGAAGAGAAGGAAGAGAAGAGSAGAAGPGGARTGGTGAAGAGGVAGSGAPGTAAGGAAGAVTRDPGAEGTGAVSAISGGAARPRPYYVPLLQKVLGPTPPLLSPLPSRSESPVRTVRARRRVSRPRPPPVPGTHSMTLRPSTAPQRDPLPSPPASSLPDGPDPESDSLHAASPTVMRFMATAVTDPLFESTAASALVAELVDFAAACRLDFATSLVVESASASVCPPSVGGECALGTDDLEDIQEEFECFAAAVPPLVSMLLALEGDPDAPDIPSPRSYAEAIEGPYSSHWQAAMDAEMASWKVKRPPGSPPVFKARYVARGFRQRQGANFFHTFSPTPKMTTLRVLLHVAAQCDYELHSLDFSTAFLQGSLHEEIWLRRPPGFTRSFPAGTQWSLRRPVYGLRQAPREWHDTLRTTRAALDELVFATADTEALAHMKSELQKRHTCIDLGELTSYLGLRITRDRAQRTITLTQSHMVLQRFGFTYSSPQSTPLPTGHSLSAPPSGESVEPSGPYPELVGCLITLGMGLVLGVQARVVLTSHADASWVDDLATQRSSQGYTFSLGSGSVSWQSTPSSSVLSFSCEAEIYAGAMAAQELRCLTYLLTDLGEVPRSPPVLYVDNKAMLALCQEHRLEHRTKHIALRYFLARELQQRGQLRFAYVASQANTADVFTKALQPCDHQRFCTVLACFAFLDWSCDLFPNFTSMFPTGSPCILLEQLVITNSVNLQRLPDDIGKLLSCLRELTIHTCSQLDQLSNNITSLTALECLSIIDCQQLCSLPKDFGELPALKSLTLESVSLSKLPDSFCHLTSLERLVMGYCFRNILKLPAELGNLTSLKTLIVQTFRSVVLPETIGFLSNLKTLHLQVCTQQLISPSFTALTSLTSRTLVSGAFSKLPEALENMSHLQHLYICDCQALGKIPELVTRLTSLVTLSIRGCKELSSVPVRLSSLRKLQQLEVTGCNELRVFPESLPLSLEVLIWKENSKFCLLPENFLPSRLRHLELDLVDNIEQFPVTLGPLPQIDVFSIRRAGSIRRGRRELENLPETVSQLQQLTLLRFHALKLASIPEGIGALSRLRELNLLECTALQQLPSSLTQLSCLSVLRLDNTSISTLPPQFSQLTRLRTLSLSPCELLEALPDDLNELKLLQHLDVRWCKKAIDCMPRALRLGIRKMHGLTLVSSAAV